MRKRHDRSPPRKRAVAQLGEDVEDIDAENALDMARSILFGLKYPVYGAGAPAANGEAADTTLPMSLLDDPEDLDGDDLEDLDDDEREELLELA